MKETLSEYRGVWVFVEIQDHERVLDASLEILSRGRELADRLGEPLAAVMLALEAEQYLPAIERHGPDRIYYCSHQQLKHYHSELFPDIVTGLIRTHRPSIALFPSSEAGRDLAPRLAQRFSTGLTTHCTELEIIDSDEHGKGLLLMKRPGFSGNMMASMICPHRRPQMATVQPGVFEKKEFPGRGTETIEVGFPCGDFESRISSLEAPLRWDTPRVPLEQSPVIIAGGRGIGSSKGFGCLAELADLLGGEVGATRVPVFNGWCGEERMIGQTGKTVRPRLYMGFGVSGQLQHTASIIDSEIIISVNIDRDAPINEISDYVLHEDAGRFLSGLIAHLKEIMVRKA